MQKEIEAVSICARGGVMLDTDRMSAADIEWARQNVPGCQFIRATMTINQPAAKPAKPSKIRGTMNGLEAAFDRACTVPHFYEQVTFWLAGQCSYTPSIGFGLVLPGCRQRLRL